MGLLVSAVAILVLVIGNDLSSIASIGSAVALLVFYMVTIGHLRIRRTRTATSCSCCSRWRRPASPC